MFDDPETGVPAESAPAAEPAPAQEPAAVQPPATEVPEPAAVKPEPEAPQPKPAEAAAKPAAAPVEEHHFTQADVDRITGQVRAQVREQERKASERDRQTLLDLEVASGKPAAEIVKERRVARVQDAMEKYAMTEEDAATYVAQQEQLARYQATEAESKRLLQEQRQAAAYQQDKLSWLNNPGVPVTRRSLAQKYMAEIEAVAQDGKVTTWEGAVTWVLGQKLDDIIAEQQRTAQVETARNVTGRAKAAPEQPENGVPQGPTLSALEESVAKAFGYSPAQYAKAKSRTKKV